MIAGQSNGEGFGTPVSYPLDNYTQGTNGQYLFQYVIGDNTSDWFIGYYNIANANWSGDAGKVVPFLSEPMIDSQYPTSIYSCNGAVGAQIIGFSMSFSKQYLLNNPHVTTLIMIQSAVGSTGFTLVYNGQLWGPGQSLSTRSINAVNSVMSMYPTALFKGILWDQGESEVNELTSAEYITAMRNQISTWRSQIIGANAFTPVLLVSIVPPLLAVEPGIQPVETGNTVYMVCIGRRYKRRAMWHRTL
jgi:hypothetical protein